MQHAFKAEDLSILCIYTELFDFSFVTLFVVLYNCTIVNKVSCHS